MIDPYRSINAYHLFPSMTLVRREPIVEGTPDDTTWVPYEFRYKPGDVNRPPPFVAPTSRASTSSSGSSSSATAAATNVEALLDRLLHDSDAVASLLVANPLPDARPFAVRIAGHRYRFSDRATRAETGAWRMRELEGCTGAIRRQVCRGFQRSASGVRQSALSFVSYPSSSREELRSASRTGST